MTSNPVHDRLTKFLQKTTEKKIAFGALIVSSMSFSASLLAILISFLLYTQPGIVQPFPPNGYAVIRGDGSFPSDALVLPLEWQNTSGKPVLIGQPALILRELDDSGKETGLKYRFLLAGEYAEVSYAAFKSPYTFENSFVIESNSVPIKVLVFHNERWWDENDPLYHLQFRSGQEFNVTIEYQVNRAEEREQVLFDLPIFSRVDELSVDHTKSYWDFWYLQDEQR